NYGYWLGVVGREADSRHFVVGEIEGHPSNPRAQIELAAFYLDHKNPARAAEHTQLAAEMEPSSTAIKVLRGKIAMANRDRKAAIEAFNSIIGPTTSVADAQVYLKMMADNGLLAESLTKLGDYITLYVTRSYRSGSGATQVENIKPLVREIADRSRTDPRLASTVASFFATTISSTPADTVLGTMMIDESLL